MIRHLIYSQSMSLLNSFNNYSTSTSTISHFSHLIWTNHEYNEYHRYTTNPSGILIITLHPLQELIIFPAFFSSLSINYLTVTWLFHFPEEKKKKSLLKAFWRLIYTVMSLIDKFIDITKYLFKTCRLWLYSAKAVLTSHHSIMHSPNSILCYSSDWFAWYKSQIHSDQSLFL